MNKPTILVCIAIKDETVENMLKRVLHRSNNKVHINYTTKVEEADLVIFCHLHEIGMTFDPKKVYTFLGVSENLPDNCVATNTLIVSGIGESITKVLDKIHSKNPGTKDPMLS